MVSVENTIDHGMLHETQPSILSGPRIEPHHFTCDKVGPEKSS